MSDATASCVLDKLNDADRHELWAALALRHCTGIGPRTVRRLLEVYPSAYAALRDAKQWHKHDIKDAVRLAAMNESWRTSAREEWERARHLQGEVILWTDARYPALLRELPDAPCLLYVRGDVSLLNNPGVGVVGTRACTAKGKEHATAMAGGLAAVGITIVSGLAKGIDTAAHTAALDLPGGTIAVLGTGLDVPYPQKNLDVYHAIAEKGLLVSECPPGTQPEARRFPVRNRLISGLALGVLVVQAAPRSGSLITARYALEQNRAVYAIGGDIGEAKAQGCQELIRQGAQVVFRSADILRDLAVVLRTNDRLTITMHQDDPSLLSHMSVASSHNAAAFASQHGSIQSSAQTPFASASASPHVEACLASKAVFTETHRLQQKPRRVVEVAPVASAGLSQKKAASPVNTPATNHMPTPGRPAPVAARLLTALAHGPQDIDSLCDTLDLAAGVVSGEMTLLEVRGSVRRLPDARYELA